MLIHLTLPPQNSLYSYSVSSLLFKLSIVLGVIGATARRKKNALISTVCVKAHSFCWVFSVCVCHVSLMLHSSNVPSLVMSSSIICNICICLFGWFIRQQAQNPRRIWNAHVCAVFLLFVSIVLQSSFVGWILAPYSCIEIRIFRMYAMSIRTFFNTVKCSQQNLFAWKMCLVRLNFY